MVSQDDIWAALNEEGFLLYSRVLKEGEGFFLKTDTTSVQLVTGTQTYSLPADCTQIVHMAERALPTDNWRRMEPESESDVLESQNAMFSTYIIGSYGASRFRYYGPYLPDNQVNNASPEADNSQQIMSIDVSPLIDQPRSTQIVYVAKWIDILDESSSMTLPEEATNALYNKTMANLLASMDDSRAGALAALGEAQAKGFLSWVRDRQLQQGPKVEPYL